MVVRTRTHGPPPKPEEWLPRVAHISISRFLEDPPKPGEPSPFLVSLHEEGTGITWQHNTEVPSEKAELFVDLTRKLHKLASEDPSRVGREQAHAWTRQLGVEMYDAFLGERGTELISRVQPTAILLDVDETVLNLPWELIATAAGRLPDDVPFGRLVTTRTIPRRGRNPLEEDDTLRILAVGNATEDLPATEAEVDALKRLADDQWGRYRVEVNVLETSGATREAFRRAIEETDYDAVHFAGHASFDSSQPEASAVHFSDGPLSAGDVLELAWESAPPYLVFNSACESGCASPGKRLVSAGNRSNGLAAAFLTAGVFAYAGYFWPVTDHGAERFAHVFYRALFDFENVGRAFQAARNSTRDLFQTEGDLTTYSAILFGDAASNHRKDVTGYMVAA